MYLHNQLAAVFDDWAQTLSVLEFVRRLLLWVREAHVVRSNKILMLDERLMQVAHGSETRGSGRAWRCPLFILGEQSTLANQRMSFARSERAFTAYRAR
jgi:hypothetical protein